MSGIHLTDRANVFAEAVAEAVTAGVPTVLIDRAVALEAEQKAALPFLLALTALSRAEPVHDPIDDIASLLSSSEERSAVSRMAISAMSCSVSARQADQLSMLRFLAEQRSPFDEEVRSFALDGMRRALAPIRERSPKQKRFNERDARSALLGVKHVFDQHGKRFFLDRGTLLGAVRERGFIATDYDIDLGIFGDEVSLDGIKQMFEPTSFEVNQDFDYKVGLLSPNGIQIDFFLTTRERGFFLSKGFRSVHNWYFSPFELRPLDFLGTTFLIPDPYEKHLEENYGNWRDTAIFYDLSYNEPCVMYGQSAHSVNYLSSRMALGLRQNDRYFSESPARALREQFGIDYTDWFPAGGVSPAVPIRPTNATSRPVVVIDSFSRYTHRLRRLIGSALGLTDNVMLCVIESPGGDEPSPPLADRLVVASAIDRVRSIRTLPAVTNASVGKLIDEEALAVVLTASEAAGLDLELVEQAREFGCTIAIFGDESIALTLDDSRPLTIRRVPRLRRLTNP